jgi:hypothetical protein
MRSDLKESLMIIAKDNLNEYEVLKKISVEDFLIKYKLFIDEVELKQNKNGR